MAAEVNRREEFLEGEHLFRRNALLLVIEMVALSTEPGADTKLVDEILHSIFFLGEISYPPFSPEDIFEDEDTMDWFMTNYPQPFQLYSSQLPRRSPFSCVLDMIVNLTGQENEEDITRKVQELIDLLQENAASKVLSPSTMCVSHTDTRKYYGVSMSTFGANSGRIMVAASCFSSWDDYVAGAVMTYAPKKVKKSYFDGTIRLDGLVRCQASNIRQGRRMNPCRSCADLFGLETTETKPSDYGNCAEVESVSNLLKNEPDVKNNVQPTAETWTIENRQRAEEHVLDHLRQVLRTVRFKWDGQYYISQTIGFEEETL